MDAGNALLAAGQLADALTQYNNAIGKLHSMMIAVEGIQII